MRGGAGSGRRRGWDERERGERERGERDERERGMRGREGERERGERGGQWLTLNVPTVIPAYSGLITNISTIQLRAPMAARGREGEEREGGGRGKNFVFIWKSTHNLHV